MTLPPLSTIYQQVISQLSFLDDVLMSCILHVPGLVHPIVLKSQHVVMKGGIKNTLQVSFEEDGVYIINQLSSCIELGIVLIEVSVDFINVAILIDCILHKLA